MAKRWNPDVFMSGEANPQFFVACDLTLVRNEL